MDDFEEQLLFPVEEPRNNIFKGIVMLVVLITGVLQCSFVPLAVEKWLISLYTVHVILSYLVVYSGGNKLMSYVFVFLFRSLSTSLEGIHLKTVD